MGFTNKKSKERSHLFLNMRKSTIVLTSSVTLLLLAGHHYFFLKDATSLQGSAKKGTTLKKTSLLHEVSTNTEFHTQGQTEEIKLAKGKVSIDPTTSVPYIHCGVVYSGKNGKKPKELLLLHGAKYNKETWVQSNILPSFCNLDPTLSVIAVDLPVRANGEELTKLFSGLKKAKKISGEPLAIVSPSASGKSVLDLLDLSTTDTHAVTQIIRGWIPVACGSITHASDHVLRQVNTLHIPTLAIYGSLDKTGKVVSEKLKDAGKAYVNVMGLNGGHPVYLDDTSRFINYVSMFINSKIYG